MTKQEIFNKAYKGLKSQGFARSYKGGTCCYNGPHNTHCAIGWVIPGLPEGFAIEILIHRRCPELVVFGNWDYIESIKEFLTELQQIHDTNSPESMPTDLNSFAVKYNLTVPETKRCRLLSSFAQ